MLAANWDIELLRMRILESDGPEALAALEPVFPEWLIRSASAEGASPSGLDRLAEDLSALGPLFGVGGGSNAWALAPSRTSTGRPILANDPHLMPAAPCQWYLARLSTPEWRAAGAAFVGTAALASGHNAHMAWGVTAGHADHTDLFLEEIGPDGASVREGDGFTPCEVRQERIDVRGGATLDEQVLITPRGPIVGPCFPGQRDAMSLSGTWLAPRPYAGLFAVHKARSLSDIEDAFTESSTTNVGFVYAHRDGEVGFLLAGDYPVRRRGWGMVPQPGWRSDVGWEPEPLPQSALPRLIDPPEGFVAAANASPMGANEAFLGGDWLDGYRQARIVEALSERVDWDLSSTASLQMCTVSLPWRELRDAVLRSASSPEVPPVAHELLADWDGRLEPDSSAASVFQFFLAEMVQRVVTAAAPNSAAAALGKGETELLPYNLVVTRRVGHLVRLLREGQPIGGEAWGDVAVKALQAAVASLIKRFGKRHQAWAWGQVRPLTLVHPFGAQAPLDRLFNVGPLPGRGDAATVHQGGVDLADPTANVIGCPTLRAVIDVGAWENSRFVLLGGQSGNPMSPHYTDQIALWSSGEGIPIHWTPEASDVHAVNRLTLTPAN